MHTKFIDPRRNGRFVFANRGSSSKVVSYLGHEAREQNKETEFFNDTQSGIKAEQVKLEIDANTKGLRKSQEKFYSLVLSPSADELKHLSNDLQKLKDYTRTVVENYARNFNLHKGKQLKFSDVYWCQCKTLARYKLGKMYRFIWIIIHMKNMVYCLQRWRIFQTYPSKDSIVSSSTFLKG